MHLFNVVLFRVQKYILQVKKQTKEKEEIQHWKPF